MFKSISEDIKQQFAFGNRITRLIIVNTFVFIAINLVNLFYLLSSGFNMEGGTSSFLKYLALSSDLSFDVMHPWVFLTHMFLHIGFTHFLFNMLYLYWFGRIVGDFLGDHRIYPLYLVSGLTGALFFLLTAPIYGSSDVLGSVPTIAYGASAAVMGIVAASGTIAPDYEIRMMFIGSVRLKYIVLIIILLDIFAFGSMANFGGHAAHIGGALFGYLFVIILQRGTDILEPVNQFFGWLKSLISDDSKPRKKKSKLFTRHKQSSKGQHASDKAKRPRSEQAKLDDILEKIKLNGYNNLSAEEKEFLFQASKK